MNQPTFATSGEPGPEPLNTWAIGIYAGDSPLSLTTPRRLVNPVLTAGDVTDLRAEFLADPFLVREAGRWLLFFEVMPLGSTHGVIGLAESVDGFDWSYRGVILRERFHLSYPHVFRHGEDWFMTPETLGPGCVRLYRASRFPDCWEHAADLMPGRHADPTVFAAGGHWWMFTCSPPDGNATLRLYRAVHPAGLWREHPRSPVVEGDSRIARPAGRVIEWGGGLLRFAQDCGGHYGVRVHAFRITTLTPDDYREETVGEGAILEPGRDGWNARGMHHVDAHPLPSGGWIAAVDAR